VSPLLPTKTEKGPWGPPTTYFNLPKQNKTKQNKTHFEVCIYSFSFGFFLKENN
jgi:hypothetical protein